MNIKITPSPKFLIQLQRNFCDAKKQNPITTTTQKCESVFLYSVTIQKYMAGKMCQKICNRNKNENVIQTRVPKKAQKNTILESIKWENGECSSRMLEGHRTGKKIIYKVRIEYFVWVELNESRWRGCRQ